MTSIVPPNEERRLQALRRAKILDTLPEGAFDAIASRAAEICGTPIACVSFVDEHRQWFKARVGLEATETDRDIAFCSHAILQDDLMIVRDAFEDERFAQNPLVTGAPNIRFYAGMPLVSGDGCALGTLCVIDREPRQLTPSQTNRLKALAEGARILLDMRASRLGELFEKAVAATLEGVTIADAKEPDTPLIFANPAFYGLTGYSAADVLGRNCRFLQGEATDPDATQRMRDSLRQRQSCVVELVNYTKAGKPFWNRLSLVPILDNTGEMTHILGTQSDVTEAKEIEAARQQLLAMRATMQTVNDIVFNFMNGLQLYRMDMEATVAPRAVAEFDSIFEETVSKLMTINGLTAFKSRTVARGIDVLDMQ